MNAGTVGDMSSLNGGWSAAVLGAATVALASPTASAELPITEGAYFNVAHVLERTAGLMSGRRAGVLVVAGNAEVLRRWAQQISPAGPTPAKPGQTTIAADGGWTAHKLDAWTTWHRHDAPVLHVAFLHQLDPAKTPLFDRDTAHRDIARRLAWYEAMVGAPFAMTPGVAAHMAIRRAFRARGTGQQPYWGVKDTRRWDDDRAGAGDLIWRRRILPEEAALGWVHSYDLRAARLAAIGVAELAWGRLEHRAVPFDPSLAGYWLIRARDVDWPGQLPPLITGGAGSMAWATTPIMRELMDRGRLPEHTDAWTAPGRRFLRELAEQWNQARLAVLPHGGPAEAAVKATYREGAGLLASPGGSIYRPDWYHTIMDRQRVTLLRHAYRIFTTHGARPLAVHTDCLWYASGQPNPARAAAELGLLIGSELGRFRHHASVPAGEWGADR